MSKTSAINTILKNWRQGDCVVGRDVHVYFLVQHDPDDDDATEFDAQKVHGFMVATQTCDVVREIDKQPFLDVCPIVGVSEHDFKQIKKELRPRYLYLPAFEEKKWVADLSRFQTVSKYVVSSWKRTPGTVNDAEIRGIQRGLARKVQRFAFPDDFNVVMQKLNDRFKKKHNKDSVEGTVLRYLKEIRVQARPSWNAEFVELEFWFLRDEELGDQAQLVEQIEKWLALFEPEGRFNAQPEFLVRTYEDLSAKDYLSSDRLDLDYLSLPV